MRILGIIQCRYSSSRLPGKALLKLGDRTVLEHVIARSLAAQKLDKVVLATSTREDDTPVAEAAEALGIEVVRGNLEDVLARFVTALDAFPADGVVRITADNPFTDPVSIDRVCALFRDGNVDYAYGAYLPYGAGADIFRSTMLRMVAETSSEPSHREHINRWFLDNNLACRISSTQPLPGTNRPDVRVTLDTPEDLTVLRRLVKALPDPDAASLAEVIKAYDSHDTP